MVILIENLFMEQLTAAFFGHRYLEDPFRIEKQLDGYIHQLLMENEYVEFLVGRSGEFDECAARAVRKAKKRYRNDNSAPIL